MNPPDRVNRLIQERRFQAALSELKKLTTGSQRFWALKMSGAVHRELGQLTEAITLLEQALAIDPDDIEGNLYMGAACFDAGMSERASMCLEKVRSRENGNYHALRYLALMCLRDKRYAEARSYTESMLKYYPDDPESNMLHGQVLLGSGANAQAVSLFDKVIRLNGQRYEGYYCKARALRKLGRIDEAIALYRQSCRLSGDVVTPHIDLADLYAALRAVDEATLLYRGLVERYPDNTEVLNSAAEHFIKLYRSRDAIALLEKSVSLNPDSANAYISMAGAYKSMGILDRYLENMRKAESLLEPDPAFFSSYLLNTNYFPDIGRQELFQEHTRWDEKFHDPALEFDHSGHDRSANRKIRIGYISADFKIHAVYYFIEPILANHDKTSFEVYCYYNDICKDQVTARFESHADAWRDIHGLTDDQTARLIHDDKIDILIDLSGHTAGNRLAVITRKPAPVQIEYEAYPNTTGLHAIEYKLTDRFLDTESDRQWHTEKLISLGECFIVYQPHENAPDVNTSLPMRKNNHVTFGSFSNLYKINNKVIDLWSRLLKQVAGSRLMIFRLSVNEQAIAHYQSLFEAQGIDKSRIVFVSEVHEKYQSLPSGTQCMAMMSDCDFILDTFPYSNHTIACEALWMGIPIVTLYGDRHATRVCATILSAVGHPELIAYSEEEYLRKAVELSGMPERIQQLRNELRTDFRNSRLMAFNTFTQNLEAVYKRIWSEYCRSGPQHRLTGA